MENVIKEIIKHRKSLTSGDLDKQKFLSLPYRIRCLIPPQSNKLSDESSLPDFAGEQLIESLVFSDQILERILLWKSNFIGEKYYEDIISSWPKGDVSQFICVSPNVMKRFIDLAFDRHDDGRDGGYSPDVIAHHMFDDHTIMESLLEQNRTPIRYALCRNPNTPKEILLECIERDMSVLSGIVYFHKNSSAEIREKIEQWASSFNYPINWKTKEYLAGGSYEDNEQLKYLLRSFAGETDSNSLHEIFLNDEVTYDIKSSLASNKYISDRLVQRMVKDNSDNTGRRNVLSTRQLSESTVTSIIEADNLGYDIQSLLESGMISNKNIKLSLEKYPILCKDVAGYANLSREIIDLVIERCRYLSGIQPSIPMNDNAERERPEFYVTSYSKKTAKEAVDRLLENQLDIGSLTAISEIGDGKIKIKILGQLSIAVELESVILSDKKVIKAISRTAHLTPQYLDKLSNSANLDISKAAKENTNHPRWRDTMIKRPEENVWVMQQFE